MRKNFDGRKWMCKELQNVQVDSLDLEEEDMDKMEGVQDLESQVGKTSSDGKPKQIFIVIQLMEKEKGRRRRFSRLGEEFEGEKISLDEL